MNVESFFKLTEYCYLPSRYQRKSPTYKLRSGRTAYFKTLKEAEENIKKCDEDPHIYAYVVTELPYNWGLSPEVKGESLSERIYLPDGTLWCANTYSVIDQDNCPLSLDTVELGNYLGEKEMFHGRDKKDIHFKPGDIVEIFGYPGNQYWTPGEVTLGIVLSTPPSTKYIDKEKEQYIATHSGYEVTPHALGYEFGHSRDVYTVATSWGIDKSPTIATLPPQLPISRQMSYVMKKRYKSYGTR